jgi:hypothetical protein
MDTIYNVNNSMRYKLNNSTLLDIVPIKLTGGSTWTIPVSSVRWSGR